MREQLAAKMEAAAEVAARYLEGEMLEQMPQQQLVEMVDQTQVGVVAGAALLTMTMQEVAEQEEVDLVAAAVVAQEIMPAAAMGDPLVSVAEEAAAAVQAVAMEPAVMAL